MASETVSTAIGAAPRTLQIVIRVSWVAQVVREHCQLGVPVNGVRGLLRNASVAQIDNPLHQLGWQHRWQHKSRAAGGALPDSMISLKESMDDCT
jgi:hypothetical protein